MNKILREKFKQSFENGYHKYALRKIRVTNNSL